MDIAEGTRALLGRREPGYPFWGRDLWVLMSLTLVVVVIGEFAARGDQEAGALPFILAMAVPTAFVNRRPRTCLAVSVFAAIVVRVTGEWPTPLAGILAVAVTSCAAAYHLGPRWTVPPGVLFAVIAVEPFDHDDAQGGNFALFVLIVAAFAIGHLLASRGRLVEQRDASVAAHATTLRERALLEERTRIARELHDVVAHHISGIAVQADTARLTTPGLPELGAERLGAIGDSARAALDEMRRLLGVMRTADAPGLAPQPGLREIADLVTEARALGATVRLSLNGDLAAVPDHIELIAYRIVQEGLTNARRHAAGAPVAVAVAVEHRPRRLRIAVRDHGPGTSGEPGPGFGLIGMRERVTAAGGTLTAGNHPTGGFEIVAELPSVAP